MDVSEWYRIRFDDHAIRLDVEPPGGEAWDAAIPWEAITRICYEPEDITASDGIYIFIRGREASYAIPTEGDGGAKLWGEIIARGLFDAKLAIDVCTAPTGTIICWPPPPEPDDGNPANDAGPATRTDSSH